MPSISQLWCERFLGMVIFELHPWISAPASCNSEFPSGGNPQNSGRHLKMFRKKLTYGNASSLNFTFRPTFAVHDKCFPFFAPKTRLTLLATVSDLLHCSPDLRLLLSQLFLHRSALIKLSKCKLFNG